MTQPAYHIKQLEHRYNRHPVLTIDELSIQPASITGLIGPNGSGKSTFLKLLAFIKAPAAGQIAFKGKPLEPFAHTVRRERITLLTQEPYLLRRSVAENIAYGLKVRGDTENLAARIEQALQWVGLDGTFLKRPWYELSGGEAQRIALAAHEVLGCRDLSRVDLILDGQGEMEVLEVNTIPGFTNHSLVPMAAQYAGLTFDQLIDRLVRLATERR